MFDVDGYPTDETLKRIEDWPYTDINGCLDFVQSCWHWPDCASNKLRPEEVDIVGERDGERFLRLATGGWSGNESVVCALRNNRVVWAIAWQMHARGGLFIFKYQPDLLAVLHGGE